MTNELSIVNSLDQPLSTKNDEIMAEIDNLIDLSIVKRDASIALDICAYFVQVSKLSGMGLAKALYYTKLNWHNYDVEEDFRDVAFERLGLHKATIDRYISVYSMFDTAVPEQVEDRLVQQNIKALIPIAKAIEQGHEISNDDWEELAQAPDYNTVSNKIRKIKGTTPRKGSLQIFLERDGSMYAIQDSNKLFCGYLAIDEENKIIQKAIQRILKNSGIIER